MKKLMHMLFGKKEKEYSFEYGFKYNDVITDRARAINVVALEAAAHLTALKAVLDDKDSLTSDAVLRVNKALGAVAAAIETSMNSFDTVMRMAAETECKKVFHD